jgi:methyl coenzyme M reductase gamma subunit
MAYKPQYGPGTSKVAENRRKQMNSNPFVIVHGSDDTFHL